MVNGFACRLSPAFVRPLLDEVLIEPVKVRDQVLIEAFKLMRFAPLLVALYGATLHLGLPLHLASSAELVQRF
jgi:hypothetical protein